MKHYDDFHIIVEGFEKTLCGLNAEEVCRSSLGNYCNCISCSIMLKNILAKQGLIITFGYLNRSGRIKHKN